MHEVFIRGRLIYINFDTAIQNDIKGIAIVPLFEDSLLFIKSLQVQILAKL